MRAELDRSSRFDLGRSSSILLSTIALTLVVAPFLLGPAVAQVCAQPCPEIAPVPAGKIVQVDMSGQDAAGNSGDTGVLRRSERETAAPLFATYVGVSAVGATLALITAHRRGARRRETELLTGVARRRRPPDFWSTEFSSDRLSI